MNTRVIRYQAIPSLRVWKKDSNVKDVFVKRKSDPILDRIDTIIETFERSPDAGAALYLRFELFFSTNYWLTSFKHQHTMFKMRAEREPAMWALFRYNANDLARGFGVGTQALANTIERYYGRSMGAHGRQKDTNNTYHYFHSQAEREKFKLFYKGGLVYQLPWRDINSGAKSFSEAKPVKANSSVVHRQTESILQTGLEAGHSGGLWAFFVMSMARDLYMMPHGTVSSANAKAAGQVPKYHSSIFSGMPVSCAGTILIVDGHIKGIQNDSGHYQPTNLHMLSALEQFSMMGLPLKLITVFDYGGSARASGDVFLKSSGNWKNVRQRMTRSTTAMADWESELKKKYGKRDKVTKKRLYSFRDLVTERYVQLIDLLPHHYQEQRWLRAYRDVALALGEVHEKFWKMAGEAPIPFAPPRPQVAKPRVPGTTNQPKAPRRGPAPPTHKPWRHA